jgi:membrane protease YdiL (CAAX protease family)
MNSDLVLESSLATPALESAQSGVRRINSKPRVWTVFATWLAAVIVGQIAVFAGFVAAGLGIGVVMGAQGADPAAIQLRVQETFQQPLPALLLTLLPFQLGMMVVVLFAARRSQEPLKKRLGFTLPSGRTFGSFKLATMAAFTVSSALAIMIGSSLLFGEPPATPLGSALSDGSWWTVTLISVLLSVIPALVEETLIRGYIQHRLLQRWSPSAAIGVSTVLFAVMHADSLQHIIAVLPLGVITGMLAYRTNSVKPGMLVHALHNIGVVKFGALARVLTPQFGDESAGLIILGAVVVLGLLGLPAIISLLRRSPAPSER